MQIGPRIRVGGSVGHLGEAIKKEIPGVGSMVGGLVGGFPGTVAGSFAQGGTDQFKHDLTTGVRDAALLYGAHGVPSVGGLAGVPSFAPGGNEGGGPHSGFLASVGKYAPLLLSLANAYESHQRGKKADQLADRAIQSSEERQRRAEAASAELKNIQRPDLSDIYTDPGNPYARRRIPAVGSQR